MKSICSARSGVLSHFRAGVFALLALSLWAAASGVAWAQVPTNKPKEIPSPITDRFYLRGIYQSGTAQTDARLDPSATQVGTAVSAEEDLGLDDKLDLGRMELSLRIRERNRLRVDYLKLNRDGDSVLTRQIVAGNDTYNVNDRVLSKADLRLLGFTYTRSLLKREKFEAGVGLGFYLVDAEGRAEVRARNIRELGNAVAVLPTLAADMAWRITRRWSVTARAQYLGVEVDDVDGSFADYHLDVQYRWKPNLALGLGYTVFDIDVVSVDINDPGQFQLRVDGPELFFRVSF